MKTAHKVTRISVAALVAALASILLSSCGDITSKTGNIGYNFGVIRTESTAQEDIDIIMDAYRAAFGGIRGAIVTDNYVYMEGKYSETNDAVLKACGEAEKALSAMAFGHIYVFSINVVYPSDTDSNFYVKKYGTE